MTSLIRQMEAEDAYPTIASEQPQAKRGFFTVHADVGSGARYDVCMHVTIVCFARASLSISFSSPLASTCACMF